MTKMVMKKGDRSLNWESELTFNNLSNFWKEAKYSRDKLFEAALLQGKTLALIMNGFTI